jgi:hypothetical protein
VHDIEACERYGHVHGAHFVRWRDHLQLLLGAGEHGHRGGPKVDHDVCAQNAHVLVGRQEVFAGDEDLPKPRRHPFRRRDASDHGCSFVHGAHRPGGGVFEMVGHGRGAGAAGRQNGYVDRTFAFGVRRRVHRDLVARGGNDLTRFAAEVHDHVLAAERIQFRQVVAEHRAPAEVFTPDERRGAARRRAFGRAFDFVLVANHGGHDRAARGGTGGRGAGQRCTGTHHRCERGAGQDSPETSARATRPSVHAAWLVGMSVCIGGSQLRPACRTHSGQSGDADVRMVAPQCPPPAQSAQRRSSWPDGTSGRPARDTASRTVVP